MDQHSLEDLISDASFVRWIRGEATSREAESWNRWLREDPKHKHLVKEAKNLLTAFQREEEIPSIHGELEELEKQLDRESGRVSKSCTYIHFHESKQNRTLYRRSKMLTAAAVFLVAAITGLFTFYEYPHFQQDPGRETRNEYTNTQEYRTDFGEKATFRLSDDSRIVLNANSHIRFSSGLESGKSVTEVWLEGEAWFDIAHFEDERRRTFTVHTDDGSVEVLGTRFAVKTLENETRTVLDEGKIQVFTHAHQTRPSLSQSQISGEGGQAGTTVLQPGEMALYSTDSESVAVKKVNSRIYTSWSEDIWFFEDTPLTEIARRIEDTFGLEVEVEKELADRTLSGSIKGTDVDVLAEALSKILDAKIQQRDHKLFIDEKILIK